MKMRYCATLGLFLILSYAECLIVPEELPSLLSLVYSNIPPIKKGTDSRIGLGFRLGPHADFQVLLELGPQKETDPLGSATTENPAKREILVMRNPQKLADYVNNLKNYFSGGGNKKEKTSSSSGGKWIDWWRENLLSQNEIGKIQFKKVPGIDDLAGEASDSVLVMEKDPSTYENSVVHHLRQLYKARPKDS